MKTGLAWGLLSLMLAGSVATGFAVHAPLAQLYARPGKVLAGVDPELAPGASIARGAADLETLGRDRPLTIAWRLAGPSFDPVGIGFEVTFGGVMQGWSRLILTPANRSAQLRSGTFTASVAPLLALSGDVLGGEATVTVERAHFSLPERRFQSLQGQLLWRQAIVRLDEQIPLGTVHGALSMAPDTRLKVVVSSVGSDTALSGTVLVDTAGNSADLDLTVRPGPDAPDALMAILDGWGTRDGEVYAVKRTVALP